MVCEFRHCNDIIVAYVEGRLAPYLRKAFEEHYFACDQCFKELQTMEQVIWLMRHHGEEIFAPGTLGEIRSGNVDEG